MENDNLEFRPGTVIPMPEPMTGWTFTLRDQFDRTWHAYQNISATYVYEKAYEAKAAMRKFCGVTVDA